MGEVAKSTSRFTKEEEAKAEIGIWRYVFGFTEIAAVKCAIEMRIADILETREGGAAITLGELSSLLGCSPSTLHRLMRFLTRRGVFKEEITTPEGHICYSQTPLSRRLRQHGENSMAAFVLLESSPTMLAPWHELRGRVLVRGGPAPPPFDAAHGKDIWEYAEKNPEHSKLINDAMACHARLSVPVIIEHCPEVFEGVRSLVDVGGGDGTTVRMLVEGFPWIRGINFDLPHVVSSSARDSDSVEHVGGDMFDTIPQADAAFIMWVLHDWGDDECIRILKNCRAAVPEATGKVIIAEAVVDLVGDDGDDEHKKLEDVALMLDMVMMAHTTNGKERTSKEWDYILKAVGFSSYEFKKIPAVQTLIVAYP